MLESRPAVSTNSFAVQWADVLLVLTVLFWGVNFSVVKFALDALPPLVFNGLRFLIASGTMLVLALATGHRYRFQGGCVRPAREKLVPL